MNLNPTFAKLAILAVVTAVLCIVLAQIGGLVHERQSRQHEAAQSVEQSLAGPQAFAGPVIARACRESWTTPAADGKKEFAESRDFWVVAAPAKLKIGGGISPEVRHRGLFTVNTYASQLDVEAHWDRVTALAPKTEHANGRLACGEPAVVLTLSDSRGIRTAELKLNGRELSVQPGTTHPAFRGLHALLPELKPEEPLTVSLRLNLVGSQRLAIVPAAGDTQVALQSSWPHPSFTGQFLPIEHQIGVSGFTARWQVSSLASTAVADLQAGRQLPTLPADDGAAYPEGGRSPQPNGLDVLAIDLIDPVNAYVMADRAIKYGLIFVALTFVTVGLTELLSGQRVHPVQYLLVGMAISLFFLLLLSLSEHLSFLRAYLIAATAAAVVLTQYAAAMLGGWLRGLAFGAGIALMYGALYVLLKQEQAALLIGAVLLFAVLAVVMTLTRKLDWYRLGNAPE
ncbi:MAG: cell envelope integrity protein CreD [Burkholderiales bacterium]|nr:cell envelope integrity protein CreD [Burkholderiales bacterium]